MGVIWRRDAIARLKYLMFKLAGRFGAQLLLFTRKKTNLVFLSVISDESTPKSADLYIRSVRFSPDGKLIATGAEDHKIRVCPFFFDGRCLYLLTD
jgi:hypothetical protein